MAANDVIDSKALLQCEYLWKEHQYRHDLIWQRVFSTTTAVVLISIIPYVQRSIALTLGSYILLAPLLATFLAGFVLLVMWNELKLFGKIKSAYRRQQNILLPDDLQHPLDKKDLSDGLKHTLDKILSFDHFVKFYLFSLVVLSVVNGIIVWLVWLPKIREPFSWLLES